MSEFDKFKNAGVYWNELTWEEPWGSRIITTENPSKTNMWPCTSYYFPNGWRTDKKGFTYKPNPKVRAKVYDARSFPMLWYMGYYGVKCGFSYTPKIKTRVKICG